MSILYETSSVKHYTGINTTQYDDLILDLEIIILDDITSYCKNYFTNSTMYFWDDQITFSTSTGNNTILSNDTDIDFTDYFISGNTLKVQDTIQNNGYYSVNEVGTSYIITSETINTESNSTGKFPIIFRVEFPKDLSFIASRMVKHLVDVQNKDSIISETLGDYSYTLNYDSAGSNMYPSNILNGLKKYRKVRFL